MINIPRSSYYYHRLSLQKTDPESELKARILAIFHENKGRYGYRRITAILRRELIINHKKVQRIMQLLNLKSLVRPKQNKKKSSVQKDMEDELFNDELNVTEICEELGMNQSAISHQLKILRASDVVKARREGKSMLYSLADDHVKTIIAMGKEHIEEV